MIDKTSRPISSATKIFFAFAIAVHVLILVSWRTGTLIPLFFDATATQGRRGWDFFALYQAGHNVLTGISAYESDGAKIDMIIPEGRYTPFRYLPLPAYTAGVILNLVPPRWAFRLWVAFIELCLLACVAITCKLVADPDRRLKLVAVWLCYTPYYLELYMGQFSIVQSLLFFLLLFFALKKSNWGIDASWIGSVLWKQNTALLLPLMIRLKRWRTLVLLAILVTLTSAPYFALFPGSFAAFWRNFDSAPPWFQLGNLGFRQLVFDAMWAVADTFHVALSQAAYIHVQTIVMLVFVSWPGLLLLLDRRPDLVTHAGLWMTSYFLIYHHVWEHHYVMLLPVLVTLMMQRRSRWLWAFYVLLALPTPFYLIDPHGRASFVPEMRWTPLRPLWQDLVYHSSKAVPTLLFYFWQSWQILRPIARRRRGTHNAPPA